MAADRSDAPAANPQPGAAPSAIPQLEPGLYVVATPIGNLRDITLRALDVLRGAAVVFAEDTRVTRKLLSAHGVSARLEAYHEHNAEAAGAKVLAALARGEAVALTTDAGTPLVSDPGYRLARAAIAAGHKVIPIPGASAPLAALTAAGLPTDRFLFAGFPPPKSKARRDFLAELVPVRATLIFFETGPRLAESLADMAAVFGQREAAIARELTKLYEEVRRGALADLARAAAMGDPPKGEIVVLVGPGEGAAPAGVAALDAALKSALAEMPLRDAAQAVADRLGLPKRAVYSRALALKDEA